MITIRSSTASTLWIALSAARTAAFALFTPVATTWYVPIPPPLLFHALIMYSFGFMVGWFNGLIIVHPLVRSHSPSVCTHPAPPRSSLSSHRITYTPGSTGGGTEGRLRSYPPEVTSQRIMLLLCLLMILSCCLILYREYRNGTVTSPVLINCIIWFILSVIPC